MARPARPFSLRSNLLGLTTALLASAALTLLVWVLPQQLFFMARTWAERRATSVAYAMASAAAPGLEFEDRERVTEVLRGLAGTPEVLYVWVRHEDGSLLASWPPDFVSPQTALATPGVVIERGVLHVVAAVRARGAARGTLGIDFSMIELEHQERQNLLLVASTAATVFALGLAFAVLSLGFLRRRRRAEEALQLTESAFRALIEQSPDPMAVYRDGLFTRVNQALVSLLGYEQPADLVGRPLLGVLHESERAATEARTQEMVATGKACGPYEVRLLRRDGTVATAEAVGMPLVVEGQPSLVAIVRDLTERRQLLARMMQMDRLIAVGTLAAGVAHEINNPLAFVIGNLDWMERKIAEIERRLEPVAQALLPVPAPGAETHRADLQAAVSRLARFQQVIGETRAGAERVRLIVRDLKTLSRAEDERRGPIALEKVVESAAQMAWNEIRHRAQLVKDYGPAPKVVGNEARLGQVFLNLIVNAAQAIDEGQAEKNTITLRIGLEPARDSSPGGVRVVASVQDTGSGMTPEVMARIFDPFFTTKPVGHGTGLGLSICQSIVQGMGGEIQLESEPGKGSIFKVVLPSAGVPDLPETATPLPVPQGRRGQVLVVDDEPLVGALLRRTLEEEHEVAVATSAREALARLAGGERFDVILCDVMMPDVTGYELYEELFQYAPDQARRMVFLTGGAFTPRAREFLAKVKNRCLDKPFDSERLRGLVRMMVK